MLRLKFICMAAVAMVSAGSAAQAPVEPAPPSTAAATPPSDGVRPPMGDRIAAATALLAGDEVKRAITEFPEREARRAAERGDFRFVNYHVLTLEPDQENAFVGVECSFPRGMRILMTRAEFRDYLSDIPGSPEPPVGRNRNAYRMYNAALISHPSFPYRDVCRPAQPDAVERNTDYVADRHLFMGEHWWTRMSDQRAGVHPDTPPLVQASRNGELPLRLPRNQVNATDIFGMSALSWSIARGAEGSAIELLTAGAEPWLPNYCNGQRVGRTNRTLNPSDRMEFWSSPIIIGIMQRQDSMVSRMLAFAERQSCLATPTAATVSDHLLIYARAAEFAKANGAIALQRRFVVAALNLASRRDIASPNDYNEAMQLAWQSGAGQVFRDRPVEDIRDRAIFLNMVAAFGSSDDLNFWLGKLAPLDRQQVEVVATRLLWTNMERRAPAVDFVMNMERVIGAAGHLSQSERDILFSKVFGESLSELTELEPEALRVREDLLRQTIKKFIDAGYDVNRYVNSEPSLSPISDVTLRSQCTVLMRVVSAGSDGCRGRTNSVMARLLLEVGADPNLGRTASGLTALDLVRRRIAGGSDRGRFAEVERMMLARGAVSATAAPQP